MTWSLQKASMWKRISAFLFDGIVLGVVVVLLGWAMSAALGYDRYYREVEDAYARYAQAYGVNFNLSLSEYESLTEAESSALNAAYAALDADESAVYAYNMLISLTLLILSLSVLSGLLLMDFAVPLLLGNGQTLGKKIFGLGLMRCDGVRVNAVTMFVRTLLGKYALETMIPLLIVIMIFLGVIGVIGPVILGLILLMQLGLVAFSTRRTAIHDLLASTVEVDLPSQRIFPTREDMIAFKQKAHAEKVSQRTYP